jgi:hypothetical protein
MKEFKVPMNALSRTKDAEAFLDVQFELHECGVRKAKPKPKSTQHVGHYPNLAVGMGGGNAQVFRLR